MVEEFLPFLLAFAWLADVLGCNRVRVFEKQGCETMLPRERREEEHERVRLKLESR